MDGHIVINFKKDVRLSEIEKALSEYTYEKIFRNLQPEADAMSRLYLIYVQSGEEQNAIQEINEQHRAIIDYVHQPALKKPISER